MCAIVSIAEVEMVAAFCVAVVVSCPAVPAIPLPSKQSLFPTSFAIQSRRLVRISFPSDGGGWFRPRHGGWHGQFGQVLRRVP